MGGAVGFVSKRFEVATQAQHAFVSIMPSRGSHGGAIGEVLVAKR